jgi:FtsP/CotA-like multicopper oxidase with cupredoxin domain
MELINGVLIPMMVSTELLNGIPRLLAVNYSGIPPGQSFNYTPNLQDQVGTYWVHTHIKGQYPEGLRAPLIVDDLDVPFKYDFDEVMSVSDWVFPPVSLLMVVQSHDERTHSNFF